MRNFIQRLRQASIPPLNTKIAKDTKKYEENPNWHYQTRSWPDGHDAGQTMRFLPFFVSFVAFVLRGCSKRSNSVGARLRRKRVDADGLQVDRFVLEPVGVTEPQRVLQPVRVVAVGKIASRLSAARLAPRRRGDDRRLRRLDLVVELERLDARRVEHAALVLDRGARNALLDLHDLLDAFRQQLLVAVHAAVRLHRLADRRSDVGDRLARARAVDTGEPCERLVGGILRQLLVRLRAQ